MNVEQCQPRPDPAADRLISALHVGKYFPPFSGGMENFLADLLRALARDGVTTPALVHDHRAGLRATMVGETVNGIPRNNLVPDHPRTVRVYRAPSHGRLLYAPVSPQFPYWLRHVLRVERPAMLHLHLPNPSAFWAMALPAARRLPWVVHWHADVVPSDIDRRLKIAYPVFRRFEKRLLKRADAIVVTSPPYLAESEALAPWRTKCRMIPLGLDPDGIPPVSDEARRAAEAAWGDASFRVLAVGRLTYYKGHEYLVRAMLDVPDARTLIVGGGERRQSLERLIAKLGIDKRVVLAGDQPADHLHALMETCHCLCLPSTERTEAFGMVLLEAMAHGRPVVVCDIRGSGVPWVVQGGHTGVVVPPADPAALANALRALAADPEKLRWMGHQGRRRYQDTFRIDQVSRKIVNLYQDVLGIRQYA